MFECKKCHRFNRLKPYTMKNLYRFLLIILMITGFSLKANAQTLVVSGSEFLTVDSIGFVYNSPNFSETDWIGIYKVEETPGGPASSSWGYIPSAEGTVYLDAPAEPGNYIAYLFCCDGYEILATSTEITVYAPVLTCSSTTYLQGDPIVFNYVSPKFSSSDWIGIYPKDTIPGSANPSIDWKYLPDSAGTMTFTTTLDPGIYDAHLLCCDGYNILASCTFEITNPNVAFVIPKASTYPAGSPIELLYNDPLFAAGDWIGVYFEGDDPALVTSAAWVTLTSKSGTVSLPGTLAGGNYFAALFCCNSNETEYARSKVFVVEAGAAGTYVKTSASVYPEGVPVLVNYRDMDYVDTDWLGIYPKGETPGGPSATLWAYVPSDSGTVAFNDPLQPGEYVVYLLCCDGYNIKAKTNFNVVDSSSPSLVAGAMTFAATDSLTFYYNSPNFVSTDWIGVYHPGDVPGEINSITWKYLPETKGTMVFAYPDDHDLPPGEYWAGLFCCDGYDLYAKTNFIITEGSSGINQIDLSGSLRVYPNPAEGIVNVSVAGGQMIHEILVYGLSGQVLHQEKVSGAEHEKTLNLKHLNPGIYFIAVQTGEAKTTRKVILK